MIFGRILRLILVASLSGATLDLAALTVTIAAAGGGDYTTFAAAMAGRTMTAGDRFILKAGTYDERWVLNGSGTNGNEIIIQVNYGDTVTLRGIDVNTRSYIKIYGAPSVWKSTGLIITQPTSSYNYGAISFNGGDHNWFQDIYIHDTYRGVEGTTAANNDYNVFHHVSIVNAGQTGLGVATQTSWDMRGDNNAFQWGEVKGGMDCFRVYGTNIRLHHNYLGLRNSTLYTGATSPYPNHSDGMQTFESYEDVVGLVYSYNFDADNQAGSADAANNYSDCHSFIAQDTTTASPSGNFNKFNLSFNLMVRPSGGNWIFNGINNVHLFNNGHVQTNQEDTRNVNGSLTTQYAPGTGYDIINNYWALSPNLSGSGNKVIQDFGTPPSSLNVDYNRGYNVSGTHPWLPAQTHNTNVNANPTFVDSSTDNYRLQSGSTYRSSGAYATTASNSGSSSTTLTVANADKLVDPTTVPGQVAMQIKIGAGAYVGIASISGTTVTLKAPRTWSTSDQVLIKGMEDVGPLPFSYATTFTISTVNTSLSVGANTLTATVSNTDAVAAVEWLVDGVSIGMVEDSPYSQSYTSDGANHVVTARALRAWADFADGATVTEDTDTLGAPITTTPARARRGAAAGSIAGL